MKNIQAPVELYHVTIFFFVKWKVLMQTCCSFQSNCNSRVFTKCFQRY